jgi:hypothetical protein
MTPAPLLVLPDEGKTGITGSVWKYATMLFLHYKLRTLRRSAKGNGFCRISVPAKKDDCEF